MGHALHPITVPAVAEKGMRVLGMMSLSKADGTSNGGLLQSHCKWQGSLTLRGARRVERNRYGEYAPDTGLACSFYLAGVRVDDP